MIRLSSVILVVFVFLSGPIQSTRPIQKPSVYLIKKAEINQKESFEAFWLIFRKAALSKNKSKVITKVHFPFKDNFNDIYDPSNSLTCANQNQFLKKYAQIFNDHTLKAIKINRFRRYNKKFKEDGDVIKPNEILLMTKNPNRSLDLIFKKINGRYKLVGIQYYD